MGGDAEAAKYFTFFTLFDPSGIAAGESAAWAGAAVLLAAGAVLYALAVGIFAGKIFPFETAPALTTVVYCYLNELQAKENPI